MVNRGVAPFDPATSVGQFRVLAGDTGFEPLNPAEEGFGNYLYWSDPEIEAYLAASNSVTWAVYFAYLQLASGAAIEAKSITDQDLRIDTTKRADALLKIADLWRQKAQDEDAAAGSDEAFELFAFRGNGEFIPEASPAQWGREYRFGRWR